MVIPNQNDVVTMLKKLSVKNGVIRNEKFVNMFVVEKVVINVINMQKVSVKIARKLKKN